MNTENTQAGWVRMEKDKGTYLIGQWRNMIGTHKRGRCNDLTQVMNLLENQLARKGNQIMRGLILII